MLRPVNLKDIKPDHLIGCWRVQCQVLSKSDPDSLFVSAKEHTFLENGIYALLNGKETLGTWNLTTEDELIKNPLLEFIVNDHKEKAIITLLLYSEDKKFAQLTIYLSTGLELVLLKK